MQHGEETHRLRVTGVGSLAVPLRGLRRIGRTPELLNSMAMLRIAGTLPEAAAWSNKATARGRSAGPTSPVSSMTARSDIATEPAATDFTSHFLASAFSPATLSARDN